MHPQLHQLPRWPLPVLPRPPQAPPRIPPRLPPAGPDLPTLEGLDQLCAEEELDLAGSQHLATTRADVDVDPDMAAYAEAELERVGQEAWQVWNSTRPVNTQKTYAKGKRVWYEWCQLRGFRDGPLVRELKVVLWLKEYVLRLTTTHRKRGVNRPSRLLKGENTEQQRHSGNAASTGTSFLALVAEKSPALILTFLQRTPQTRLRPDAPMARSLGGLRGTRRMKKMVKSPPL
jgi:hypothetical protein